MNFLSVDIGGTRIKWGVINDEQIVTRGVAGTPAGDTDALLDTLAGLHTQSRPDGWAVAVCGEVADDVLVRSAHLQVTEPVDVAAELHARCGVRPAAVVNDLAAACAAEADGSGPVAVMFVGTGIGAKVAVDGRVLCGGHGRAGEVGHLRFRDGGRACPCGRAGCAEAYAGWHGLRAAYAAGSGVTLSRPAQLLTLAQAGDQLAGDLIEDALDAAGFAAAALVSAYDPQVLRIGGGMVAAFDGLYLQAIRLAVSERCWQGQHIPVQAVQHGEDGPLLGLYRLACGRQNAG